MSPRLVWSQHLVVLEPFSGGWRPVCLWTGGWTGGQVVAEWGWQPTCSFSVLWCGEDFHKLWVEGVKVSAVPGALPQPSVSPASQQVLWFPELTQSASVSQSPFFQQFLLICGFVSSGFSYLQLTVIWKYYMKNSRNKQFINFKLCSVLSSMMKCHTISLFLTQDIFHPVVQWIYAVFFIHPLVT
jgi:hypothetical protein